MLCARTAHTCTLCEQSAPCSIAAYGWLEDQDAITDRFKDLLDARCCDVVQVPDDLRAMALSAVTAAAAACTADEVCVLVPFPSHLEGVPHLLHAVLTDAVGRVAENLQCKVVAVPLLARSRTVQRRSTLSADERSAQEQEQQNTLHINSAVSIPGENVKYCVIDDLVHTGASVRSGTLGLQCVTVFASQCKLRNTFTHAVLLHVIAIGGVLRRGRLCF